MTVLIGGKEHITLVECAERLGIGYWGAYRYVMRHDEIPSGSLAFSNGIADRSVITHRTNALWQHIASGGS